MWLQMLSNYPGPLGRLLHNIIIYGAQLGYDGPEQLILSKNLASASASPGLITTQVTDDLMKKRIARATLSTPFISSPLGLVPKHNGGFRRIHHLSFPRGKAVNDHISEAYGTLTYTTLATVTHLILLAGRGCLFIKRDIKDAFRMIPVAPHQYWLLGFNWEGQFFTETCLPFGLRTAPFIFNLFAEAFHWILQAVLHWDLLAHYLDDFIRVIPKSSAVCLAQMNLNYIELTDMLGIPRNDAKDSEGTVVEILGIELDTTKLEARLPIEKLERAISLSAKALSAATLTLLDAERLTGFLNFCSQVIRLGRAFMSSLWEFIAAFPTTQGKRRLSFFLRQDLRWWCTALPSYNGVLFFDDKSRPVFQLFTDACPAGIGGFYYLGNSSQWRQSVPIISLSNAFMATVHTKHTEEHINFHEIRAILAAFTRWGPQFARSHLVINTDNTTAFHGLQSSRLRGRANIILRDILCIAAQNDILIEPKWLSSEENALADALSRSNKAQIANICPHW